MKCAHFSDTHGHHTHSRYPSPGDRYDVMFHSGDLTIHGQINEALEFIDWCNGLVEDKIFKHVIITPGNHDACFKHDAFLSELRKACGKSVHILINEEITINGFKIWASPWTPRFGRWSFMYERGEVAKALWEQIPPGVDILVTHGPPRRVLDAVPEYNTRTGRMVKRYTGCVELLEKIKELKPVVHLFGHIHEGHGNIVKGETRFFNSSIMDERYNPVNSPQTFEIKRNEDGKCEVIA